MTSFPFVTFSAILSDSGVYVDPRLAQKKIRSVSESSPFPPRKACLALPLLDFYPNCPLPCPSSLYLLRPQEVIVPFQFDLSENPACQSGTLFLCFLHRSSLGLSFPLNEAAVPVPDLSLPCTNVCPPLPQNMNDLAIVVRPLFFVPNGLCLVSSFFCKVVILCKAFSVAFPLMSTTSREIQEIAASSSLL